MVSPGTRFLAADFEVFENAEILFHPTTTTSAAVARYRQPGSTQPPPGAVSCVCAGRRTSNLLRQGPGAIGAHHQ